MPTSPQYLPDLSELGLSTVVVFLGKQPHLQGSRRSRGFSILRRVTMKANCCPDSATGPLNDKCAQVRHFNLLSVFCS